MKTEIKIPLSPTYALEVPKGSKITRLRMENDIPRVTVENPNCKYEPGMNPDDLGWETINLRTYMEGETQQVETEEKDEQGEPIVKTVITPIPEPSDKLRLLGVVATVEEGMQATWHIFEEIA